MSQLLEVAIDGETILIEAEPTFGSEQTTSADQALMKTQEAFERAKITVTSIAKSMAGSIKKLDDAVTPDQFELEFAIKFGAEGQAILASTSAEASLKITMTYEHKKGN